MGQEQSNLVDEGTPPTRLSRRSLSGVAEYIKNDCRGRIVVMTGAGLSTAAGIPDFRSPTTGLYANLARLNLPYAEAVFDISYFRQNPNPFYVLAKELYPGNYSPTVSHVFISLLAKKNLLSMLFTQNIDCLERQAGVPADRIVEAHGSFASQRCIECGRVFPDESMKTHVSQGIVPRCTDDKCGGLVKPDIVFFGEQLPAAFHANWSVATMADLIIVMGTSLTVQPFASLPDAGPDDVPRLLFNMARVGSFGTRPDDVLELGDCDAGIRKLADELGWRDELEAEWRRVVGDKEAERQLRSVSEREAALQDEVEDLADQVGSGLSIDDVDDFDGAGGHDGNADAVAVGAYGGDAADNSGEDLISGRGPLQSTGGLGHVIDSPVATGATPATPHSDTSGADSEEDFTVGWDALDAASRPGRPVATATATVSDPEPGEADIGKGSILPLDAVEPASGLGRVIDSPPVAATASSHPPEMTQAAEADMLKEFIVGWDALEPAGHLGRVIDTPAAKPAAAPSPYDPETAQAGEADRGEDVLVESGALEPAGPGRVTNGPADD